MKLRMLSSVVKFAIATALIAGVATTASAQAAPAPAGANASGYKIGVVDRKKIFDDYGKKKTQWDALSQEKTAIETELNQKFEALKQKRDAYDAKRATLSDEDRSKQENALNKELLDLQSDAKVKQKTLNDKGEMIIKGLRQEIDAAVRALAQSGNYHLILEADTAISSVIYYSDTLDITGQVLEYVNAHAGDAPAAAPETKAQPASSSDKDKGKDKNKK